MANTIQFKRGAESGIPALSDGEPGWCSDTFRMYVGQGGVNKLVGEADFLKKAGGTMTGLLTLSGDPSGNLHAATKQYVDNLVQGINAKGSVKAATTASITLSGTQTVDGVALSADDRVLVKNQTTASENGLYLCKSGAWVRTSDADSWNELVSLFVWVEEGTANGDTGWLCTADAGGTLGTTAVSFVQFSGTGQITAGAGLTKSGDTINVGAGNGIAVAADSVAVDLDGATLSVSASGLKVANSGVTAAQLAASVAGNGLTGGGGSALAVGAGDGIDVAADSIAVDVTDFIDTAYGLTESSNNIRVSLSGTGGLSFASGAVKVNTANGIEIAGNSLQPTYGSSANTVCQGNDGRLHSQNTDTGTTSTIFALDSAGNSPKLQAHDASTIAVRNQADTDYGFTLLDAVKLRSGSINGTLTKTTLTAARQWTLPNVSGNILLDVSTLDGANLSAGSVTAAALAAAVAGNGLTGGAGSALAVGAGDGIDVAANSIAVDVTDFIDTAYGLNESSNNIRINAGNGLVFSGGQLQVGTVDGGSW